MNWGRCWPRVFPPPLRGALPPRIRESWAVPRLGGLLGHLHGRVHRGAPGDPGEDASAAPKTHGGSGDKKRSGAFFGVDMVSSLLCLIIVLFYYYCLLLMVCCCYLFSSLLVALFRTMLFWFLICFFLFIYLMPYMFFLCLGEGGWGPLLMREAGNEKWNEPDPGSLLEETKSEMDGLNLSHSLSTSKPGDLNLGRWLGG